MYKRIGLVILTVNSVQFFNIHRILYDRRNKYAAAEITPVGYEIYIGFKAVLQLK